MFRQQSLDGFLGIFESADLSFPIMLDGCDLPLLLSDVQHFRFEVLHRLPLCEKLITRTTGGQQTVDDSLGSCKIAAGFLAVTFDS